MCAHCSGYAIKAMSVSSGAERAVALSRDFRSLRSTGDDNTRSIRVHINTYLVSVLLFFSPEAGRLSPPHAVRCAGRRSERNC